MTTACVLPFVSTASCSSACMRGLPSNSAPVAEGAAEAAIVVVDDDLDRDDGENDGDEQVWFLFSKACHSYCRSSTAGPQ